MMSLVETLQIGGKISKTEKEKIQNSLAHLPFIQFSVTHKTFNKNSGIRDLTVTLPAPPLLVNVYAYIIMVSSIHPYCILTQCKN